MAIVKPNDFAPSTKAESAKVDQNFDIIYNLLSGVSTDQDTILRLNHASLPVLRLDQLGTGPIILGRENLTERFRVNVDGSIPIVGAITSSGDLIITKSGPTLKLIHSPTAKQVSIVNDGNNWFFNNDFGSFTAFQVSLADSVTKFNTIPVGPTGVNPTTDNQLARKKYIDDKKVSFSVGFSIVDPANASLNTRAFGSLIIPAGGAYTITQLKLMFREGSHTAGAGNNITFTFDRSGVGDIGTLTLNDTNNTAGTVYVNDIGDITPSENAIFSVRITARNGTITEQNVMAVIEGFRTPF